MPNGGIGAGLPSIDATSKKLKVQEFLTSGTWTRPLGVDSVEILLVGGGGGGGGIFNAGNGCCSGSGGGGGVIKKTISVTSIPVGQPIAVTIGAGGAGGSASGTAGGVGGSSSFGSLLTTLGGGGGDGYPTASAITTGIATQGGGSLLMSAAVPALPGLGAGAGGSPKLGFLAISAGSSNQRYKPAAVAGIPVGSNPTIYNSPVLSLGMPSVGPAYLGYGAGGGCYSYTDYNLYAVAGEFGSGGTQSTTVNALANSGGGGSAVGDAKASATSGAGGNGGSGYALITWWE